MHPTARLTDANANRAREALRVMEDVARLGLDHAGLAERAKAVRHGLAAALVAAGIDGLAGLAVRDTAGDVGTQISGAGEGQRAGLREVAAAACKRLTEALRVLEECAKVGPGAPTGPGDGAWQHIEALRYRAYDLERDLMLALGTGRAVQWRLCVLITQALCRRPWEEVIEGALTGGADCLQLREKHMTDRELLGRARRLVEMCRRRAVVIVNDRPDIALLAGADGVHLGQTDLPVRAVRELAGSRLLAGVSTHDLAEARAAVHAGADYCGVGAMFATPTKQRMVSGATYLREYLAVPVLAGVPHLAIGGVTPENARELAAAGARGVAVSACVCGEENPEHACRALCAALSVPAKSGEAAQALVEPTPPVA